MLFILSDVRDFCCKSLIATIICSSIFSCNSAKEEKRADLNAALRFERINYFLYPKKENSAPFKHRLTYYFNNSKPHRWIDFNSDGKVMTEYIYKYDNNWKQTGAEYREDGALEYSIEKVRFVNDSVQITEWLDENGTVYYTMTDYLNSSGNTYRAEFKGDEVHGYDSTFYTKEGFPKQIFFMSSSGKKMNDRSFEYDSINVYGDWAVRKKVMNDSIKEIHVRELYYDNRFTSDSDSIFYQGILSTAEWSENTFSFSNGENNIFQTRNSNWESQFGTITTKKEGLFSQAIDLPNLSNIYNGAISPNGSKIVYSKKQDGKELTYLTKNNGQNWSDPIKISTETELSSGYFHWLNNDELFFYISRGNGNIVRGRIIDNQLKIEDSLEILNTEMGTEFSPYVDKRMRFIIFTRYIEGDSSQQGFFISYNLKTMPETEWSKPEKIESLPYGWNACIINSGQQFLFTDGNNIKNVPVSVLNLNYED